MFLHHSPADWQEGGKAACQAARNLRKASKPLTREGVPPAQERSQVLGMQQGALSGGVTHTGLSYGLYYFYASG